MPVQCRKCGKGSANRLHRGGVFEHILSVVYIYPYRCRACWRRFKALRWGTRYVRKQANRRDYRRFETSFPVVYSWGEMKGEGVVTDIAMGGCRIRTDVELAEDSPLQLTLKIPGSEEIRVERAVVCSVESVFTGLSFARLAPDEHLRLRRFLVQLMMAKAEAEPVQLNTAGLKEMAFQGQTQNPF